MRRRTDAGIWHPFEETPAARARLDAEAAKLAESLDTSAIVASNKTMVGYAAVLVQRYNKIETTGEFADEFQRLAELGANGLRHDPHYVIAWQAIELTTLIEYTRGLLNVLLDSSATLREQRTQEHQP